MSSLHEETFSKDLKEVKEVAHTDTRGECFRQREQSVWRSEGENMFGWVQRLVRKPTQEGGVMGGTWKCESERWCRGSRACSTLRSEIDYKSSRNPIMFLKGILLLIVFVLWRLQWSISLAFHTWCTSS